MLFVYLVDRGHLPCQAPPRGQRGRSQASAGGYLEDGSAAAPARAAPPPRRGIRGLPLLPAAARDVNVLNGGASALAHRRRSGYASRNLNINV